MKNKKQRARIRGKDGEQEKQSMRERERLVRGARGAIWVSKFNSAHEKATEGERRERERETERERAKTEYVGSVQRRKRPWPSAAGAAGPAERRSHSQSHSQKCASIDMRYEKIDVRLRMLLYIGAVAGRFRHSGPSTSARKKNTWSLNSECELTRLVTR